MKRDILIIAQTGFGRGLSGGDKIFIEFARYLSQKGLNVDIWVSEEGYQVCKAQGLDGVKFEILKSDYPRVSFFFAYVLRIIRTVCRAIAAEKIDKDTLVYSASDFMPDSLPAFILKLRFDGIRWIAGFYLSAPKPWQADSPYKMRGSFLKGLLYWLSQQPIRLIIKKYADMVFVTSEPDVEKFVTDKRGKDSVVVVHGAVDTRPAERYLNSGGAIPPEKRKYDACYVGRFHYQKGVLELVDIWRLVCERMPSAKLAMIGSGPLENDVKRRIEKFRLGSNIELVGYRDGDAKYEVFKQAKIVVHPATYDSGGMSAAEAMAWRLPGVSFDLESLRTYYPLGMVKVAQGDTSGFAREVIRLLTERGYYEKMAEEARRLAVGAWDWAKRADLIYKKVFKAG